MVGLFNIAGAILWSSMGGRYQRKNLLALLYLLRSLVFLGFVLRAPVGGFGADLRRRAGLPVAAAPCRSPPRWSATSSGRSTLTMLNGIVFFGHQVGSFFGGWGGGRLFDLQGNYDMMWWISIALGVVSAAAALADRREAAQARPAACRSRHEHELALLSSVGRRRLGGRPRPPCRSCCGALNGPAYLVDLIAAYCL